jgi:hypothetical protein
MMSAAARPQLLPQSAPIHIAAETMKRLMATSEKTS